MLVSLTLPSPPLPVFSFYIIIYTGSYIIHVRYFNTVEPRLNEVAGGPAKFVRLIGGSLYRKPRYNEW